MQPISNFCCCLRSAIGILPLSCIQATSLSSVGLTLWKQNHRNPCISSSLQEVMSGGGFCWPCLCPTIMGHPFSSFADLLLVSLPYTDCFLSWELPEFQLPLAPGMSVSSWQFYYIYLLLITWTNWWSNETVKAVRACHFLSPAETPSHGSAFLQCLLRYNQPDFPRPGSWWFKKLSCLWLSRQTLLIFQTRTEKDWYC